MRNERFSKSKRILDLVLNKSAPLIVSFLLVVRGDDKP
jgi:hypothetical protein